MDTRETIMTRRSVRRFEKQSIDQEKLWQYLEAANFAPTAGNRQPWVFYVIERKKIDELKDVLESSLTEKEDFGSQEFKERLENMSVPEVEGDKVKGMQQFFRNLGDAPVAVLVTVEESGDNWRDFINTQDAAAAIQNLILAAWNDGIGSCWMCGPLYKQEKIKEYLGLPEKQKLIAFVPLGYPKNLPLVPPKKSVRRKTIWID